MPNQTITGTDQIVFGDGIALEVSTDNGSTFDNVGVMAGGATAAYNYNKIETETGNGGTLPAKATKETLVLSPTALLSWNPEVWAKFSNGLFTYTNIAGTPVAGGTQLVASGDWSFDNGILLTGQNGDGTEPTINSVTGSADGAGAADDFDLAKVAGGWVLTPRDGTNFTTEVQTLTINSDYTPSAGKKITAGSSSTVLERFVVRFRHYTDDALTTWDHQLLIYGVDMDSGFTLGYKGANEDGVNDATVAFTANIDTTKSSGAQLFEMTVNASAYA